jgi:hypothetical protein
MGAWFLIGGGLLLAASAARSGAAASAANANPTVTTPMGGEATLKQLHQLSLLMLYAERDATTAYAIYNESQGHSIAGFAGDVVGVFVGVITGDPKAGIEAGQKAQQLGQMIDGADDEALKAALQRYQLQLRAIAKLMQELGFPPGTTKEEVDRLYTEAVKKSGWVPPPNIPVARDRDPVTGDPITEEDRRIAVVTREL